jgi:hypothetical protein
MKYFTFLLLAVLVSSFSAFLFSFTQIDLGLTLMQGNALQSIQVLFQQVGYFQRPLATYWYLSVVAASVFLWIAVIYGIQKKFILLKQLILLIVIQSAVLFFSYPGAYSYDIFNYIFTAKTLLFYQQNPYGVLPLWFQGIDPMLSFMRWTHLPSAYTPVWIFLTLPLYLLSGNIFLVSLPLFKILPLVSYTVSIWCIYTILKHKKYSTIWILTGVSLFAFNPLIVLESLISAHNDIVMMVFALAAYLLSLKKQYLSAWFFWACSVAVKLMTFPLGVLFFIPWRRWYAVVLLSGGLLLVLLRREFLPWYAVWIVPFTVLLPDKKPLQLMIGSLSIGLLLRYAPVLYTGGYEYPVRLIQDSATFLLPAVIVFGYLVKELKMGIMKR